MKSTIICAVLFCTALLSAGTPIKFDNNFTVNPQGKLSRWMENKLAVYKPWGTYQVIGNNKGSNALRFTAEGKEYHILSNNWYKVQEGQTVVIKVTAKGKGQFAIGSVVYTKDYKFIYSYYRQRSKVNEKEAEYTFKVSPKNRPGKNIGLGRILIVGFKGADITISKLSAEIE